MKYAILERVVIASTLLLSGFATGCTTVVTPHSMSDPIPTDGSHGLVVGDIRLAGQGSGQRNGGEQPLDLKLSLEEGTPRKRVVLTDLTTVSPFVTKLPVGSYRVNGIRIGGLGGVWHTTELPINFQVHKGGCTSLGTWELQREIDSLTDWIIGQQVELQQVLAIRECPTMAESSVRSNLAFQNRLYPWP